jgi:hypothetical protein
MTKQFDALLEQMLNEMMPADIGEIGGFSGAASHITGNVPEGEPKGHWSPLQKLSNEDRNKVLQEIFKQVFSEKENTYAPTVDNPEDLHGAIQSAIQTVSGTTGLKASGKWAAKFLADRLMTLLKNKVKYTTSGGEESLQKEMTQKEFKQALSKALEEAPPTPPQTPAEPAEPSEEAPLDETPKDVETVYTKAADLNSDDSDLEKAFNKLPDNKEMSWKEVLKTIGMTKGMALLDAGGLIETEVEKQESEDEEVKDLEFDDENEDETRGYESDFDRAMKNIGGTYTTKQFDPTWD